MFVKLDIDGGKIMHLTVCACESVSISTFSYDFVHVYYYTYVSLYLSIYRSVCDTVNAAKLCSNSAVQDQACATSVPRRRFVDVY